MFVNKYFFILLLLFFVQYLSAQILYNNGADIKVNTGGIIKVQGSAENATGTITNDGYTTINLDITNNATLQGSGTYEIWRHWINNSTFMGNASNTSLVYLNGTAIQNIQGNQMTTFWDLEIDNGLKKELYINSGVNHTLVLNDNELATDDYSFFVYNPDVNAILRNGGATYGFVSSTGNGNLSRLTNTNQSYIFPVGSNVGTLRYRPISITPNNATDNTFTVRMANVDATTEGYDVSLFNSNITLVNDQFYHKINRSNGTSSANLKFYYNESEDGQWQGLANWDSSLWGDVGQITHTTVTPFNTSELLAFDNFTNEPFALTDNKSTLPVEWSSFVAQKEESEVKLKWITASETNNIFFSIERSIDAIHFDEIAQVKGAGNSNTENYYSLTDAYPQIGNNYYRIKQVDYDGKNTYSEIRNVYFGDNSKIRIYPNPASNYLEIKGLDLSMNYSISIQNINGEIVLETNQKKIDILNLAKGMYVLILSSENKTQYFKWVKN